MNSHNHSKNGPNALDVPGAVAPTSLEYQKTFARTVGHFSPCPPDEPPSDASA